MRVAGGSLVSNRQVAVGERSSGGRKRSSNDSSNSNNSGGGGTSAGGGYVKSYDGRPAPIVLPWFEVRSLGCSPLWCVRPRRGEATYGT
jgi:hypothetical protein